jgi:hypothetical protein
MMSNSNDTEHLSAGSITEEISSQSISIPSTMDKGIGNENKDYMNTVAIVLEEANVAFSQRKFDVATTLFSQVAEA